MAAPLLILGASVRAAAMSAVRAGYRPTAADLFADTDLAALCPATAVTDYPGQLEDCARRAGPGPWLYTGALENAPELVDRIAAARPLLGNAGDVLRAVRDPLEVAALFSREGLPAPKVRRADDPPRSGRWLRKPLNSSGGRRICFCGSGGPTAGGSGEPSRGSGPAAAPVYFQQFIDGRPASAVYVADGERAVLLGVTQQLVGTPWLGARPFWYAGSIGPLALEPSVRAIVGRIGRSLARRFGLIGLFGVDLVLAGRSVWPIEVNPRYTASVEVLERALAIDLLPLHVAACRDGRLPAQAPQEPAGRFAGKAIKYCTGRFTVPAAVLELAAACNADRLRPVFADLPRAGTVLQAGKPFATALATGKSLAEVQMQLRRLWRRVDAASS